MSGVSNLKRQLQCDAKIILKKLIIDPSLFGDSRYIRVKLPGSTTNVCERSTLGRMTVTRIVFFARPAKSQDYPKLRKQLEAFGGSGIVGTSFNQQFTKLPQDIEEYFK